MVDADGPESTSHRGSNAEKEKKKRDGGRRDELLPTVALHSEESTREK